MKLIIDTDLMTVAKAPGKGITIADAMEDKIGIIEYDAYVQEIQKWFYGRMVEAAWCATGLSYFAWRVGVTEQTGKHENVDRMKEYMDAMDTLYTTQNYIRKNIPWQEYSPKRGDVVFMSSKKKFADCTHVGVVSAVDNTVGTLCVCSCNVNSPGRKDGCYLNTYNYKTDNYIVAFGKINY